MIFNFSLIETRSHKLWDYGWFDFSRFKVGGLTIENENPRRVLEGFLKDSISHRSFCSFSDPWGASVSNHGPFIKDKLLPDYFKTISKNELSKRVQKALSNQEVIAPPGQDQTVPIQSWLKAVKTSDYNVFELDAPSNIGLRVEYDYVWDFFFEFICFSRIQEELSVAVIGYD